MHSSQTVIGRSLGSAIAAALLAFGAGSASAAEYVRGFEGTTQVDNCALGQCFRPPDTMGAVGTTQFVETTNGSITVYNKATGGIASRVDMPTFWANAGLPGGAAGDQRVLFDHYTNRWIMSGFGPTGNEINIAVSDTSNALGTWKSTRITGASIGVPATTLDYPTLSMDDKGVYIGTNNFPNAGGFSGTSLLVIPKLSLFGGAPSVAGMTTFTTPLVGADRGFAIQAALNWQGNPTNTVSVIADSRDFNAQVFYKVNGVNAAGATQTASTLIAGSDYDVAGPGRQPDGSRKVDTLSPRITANAVQFDGKIFSTTTVKADAAVGDYAAVRWTVVDASTGALLSSGKIQQVGYDFYEGSIAVNEFGEVVIAYNRSGFAKGDGNGDGLDDGNISFLARAYDLSGSSLVQEGAELLLKVSGISDYHCGARVSPAACRERWGDYAAITIDPTDHHKFYAIGEYAKEWGVLPNTGGLVRAVFSTFIAEIAVVPEPGSLVLIAVGLFALSATRRRKLN